MGDINVELGRTRTAHIKQGMVARYFINAKEYK
jgi:hypothetical protein